MADTSVKLSGTYDSIEAYNILTEMQTLGTTIEEYKDDAEAAATTASGAVSTAQGYANAASGYADNASTYAGNASDSADDAAGYAANASTAATNAASSATDASNSAAAAATSETNAAASAASAAASEAVVNGALPLSGGTMTGALNTANNTWNNLGDDAAIGDHNVAGKMCVKTQISTATGIAFFDSSNTNVGQVEVNNAFDFNKAIKQNGIDLTPQTYSMKNTSSDVNVASGSVENLLSFSITKGTWVVQVVANFQSNSSGYRRLGIASSSSSSYMDRYSVQTIPAVSGVPTQLSFTTFVKTSGTNTYYLNATQTSGSTLAVSAGVLMFRLSNTAS